MSSAVVGGPSVVPGEEVPEGAAVALAEGRVDQGVEEGVGVAQPQEDTLPWGGGIAGAQGADELHGEEGGPAEHEHPDEDAHCEGGPLLLLLPPRVPFCLEGDGGVTSGEHHLGLLGRCLHLEKISRGFRRTHLVEAAGPGG